MDETRIRGAKSFDKFWLLPNKNTTIVGISQSGKSILLSQILKEWSRMFPDTRLARVLLFYAVWQPLYETFAPDNVTVDAREGMPKHIDELGTAINGDGQTAVIFDDLIQSITKSDVVTNLLTIHAHHSKLSCFYVVQSIVDSPLLRQLGKHSHYIFLTRCAQNTGCLVYLQKLLRPAQGGIFTRCARLAWTSRARYILVDATPFNEYPEYSVRSGLCADECATVYEIMPTDKGTPDVREMYLVSRQQLASWQQASSVNQSPDIETKMRATVSELSSMPGDYPHELAPVFDALNVKYHGKFLCLLRHLHALNITECPLAFVYYPTTGAYAIDGRMCAASNLSDTVHLLYSPFAVDAYAFPHDCLLFLQVLARSACPTHVLGSPAARSLVQEERSQL